MRPEHIKLITRVTDHTLAPDGSFAVMVVRRSVSNRNTTELWSIATSGEGAARQLTSGPSDIAPATCPKGERIAFIRQDAESSQLCIYHLSNGAVAVVAEHGPGMGLAASVRHLRGVSAPAWSPDGLQLAYVAPVREPRKAGSSSVQRIKHHPFQFDGRGRIDDNYIQIFTVQATAGATPRQFSTASSDHWDLCWRRDGAALCFASSRVSETGIRGQTLYEAEVDPATGKELKCRPLTDGGCTVSIPSYSADGRTVYFAGIGPFSPAKPDIRARNVSLWKAQTIAVSAAPTRITDAETLDIDDSRLRPLIIDAAGDVTVSALFRGGIHLGTIANGKWAPVIEGRQQVLSYARSDIVTTAVIADETHAGDLFVLDAGAPRRLTDFSSDYSAASLHGSIELNGAAKDGYPVHGWLVIPPTPGPFPLLLLIHGGPDTQWGYVLNEEAQVYASAGFAVLMPNPRGSAGYGETHARVLNGRLGTVDVDDILALLEMALERDDINSANVGVLGRSYGGFMTAWLAARYGNRFYAAVGECGVYDWGSAISTSDIGWQLAEMVGEDPNDWAIRSPLTYAGQVNIPFMVMQYLSDLRIPYEQGHQFFATLFRSGAPTELVQFDGGPHNFADTGPPDDRVARLEIILEWFAKWLAPPLKRSRV